MRDWLFAAFLQMRAHSFTQDQCALQRVADWCKTYDTCWWFPTMDQVTLAYIEYECAWDHLS